MIKYLEATTSSGRPFWTVLFRINFSISLLSMASALKSNKELTRILGIGKKKELTSQP